MIASWLAGQPLAEWKREHFGRVPYVKPDSASSAVPLLDWDDVFIVQTSGSKDYRLRANTVNPRPTIDAMPRDMRFELERTPVIACTLLPGDWLYVPRGFWHVAHARDDSLSLSIGVLTPQARGARPARAPAAWRRSRVSSETASFVPRHGACHLERPGARAMAKQRGEVMRSGNRPEPAKGRDERGGRSGAGRQQGGSRGGSNQTGPARDSSRHSRRGIAGTDQVEHESPTPGGTADAIRGPMPEGAAREDYVGGEQPHKTREKDTKTGTPAAAGGKRNQVI